LAELYRAPQIDVVARSELVPGAEDVGRQIGEQIDGPTGEHLVVLLDAKRQLEAECGQPDGHDVPVGRMVEGVNPNLLDAARCREDHLDGRLPFDPVYVGRYVIGFGHSLAAAPAVPVRVQLAEELSATLLLVGLTDG